MATAGWRPSLDASASSCPAAASKPCDRADWVRRAASAVAPGGRLIVCNYADLARGDPLLDVPTWLAEHGFAPRGHAAAPGVSLAWIEPS